MLLIQERFGIYDNEEGPLLRKSLAQENRKSNVDDDEFLAALHEQQNKAGICP
jgi:hypothetical protein